MYIYMCVCVFPMDSTIHWNILSYNQLQSPTNCCFSTYKLITYMMQVFKGAI